MPAATDESPHTEAYWTLIRDVAVLQVKLVVDGLRDLVLLPASLVAGVLSLIDSGNGRPGPQFYRLLSLGRRSERWINLFGAIRNSPEPHAAEATSNSPDMDDIVSRVEAFVVDEYNRGAVTRQAKERIDQALRTLERRNRRS